MSPFQVGPMYSFIFLSFFPFIFNMKSSDSSFVAKAVNSCRNIGQNVSSELPRSVFKLWVLLRGKVAVVYSPLIPLPSKRVDKEQN